MQGPIVVGTDGSPGALNAVDEAGRLARADGCKVHVVSAYKYGAAASIVPEAAAHLDLRRSAEDALRAASERLATHSVPVEQHAVEAPAADALIDVAATHKARLIVVGSRGMRGVGRVLGSVPNTVTHRAACNVLVVRTD